MHNTDDRLVFEAERAEITGYSRQYWYRLELNDPAIPQRIKLGDRKVAWLLSELLDWRARRVALRTPVVPAVTQFGYTGADAPASTKDTQSGRENAPPVKRPRGRPPRKAAPSNDLHAETTAPNAVLGRAR